MKKCGFLSRQYLMPLFLLISISGISWLISVANREHFRQQEEFSTLNGISLVRARLEGALNRRLLLGAGLTSYLAVKPDLTENDFFNFTSALFEKEQVIRNISVIKNTTVLFVYPLQSNREVIGRDLTTIKEQREGILRVKSSGRPEVFYGVKLLQGGTAAICRLPVHSLPDSEYWGQVSIVLMQDALLAEGGMTDNNSKLQFLLTGPDQEGHFTQHIAGDAGILNRQPLQQEIIFPHGSWLLSAIPEEGWGYSDKTTTIYLTGGLTLALLISLFAFFFYRTRNRMEQLESFLPICSNCKKIRDKEGNWNILEQYFHSNSELRFSHTICKECAEKLYGKEHWFSGGHSQKSD